MKQLDKLSQTLQGPNLSALESYELAKMTVNTLKQAGMIPHSNSYMKLLSNCRNAMTQMKQQFLGKEVDLAR